MSGRGPGAVAAGSSGGAAAHAPLAAGTTVAGSGAPGAGAAPAGRRPWITWLLAGVAGGAAVAALLGWAAAQAGAEPVCALRRLAGVECATCGATRSLALIARGDWGAALVAHPWVPLAMAQLPLAWGAWGLWLAGRLARRPDRWVPRLALANLAALAAWWAARWALGSPPA